MKEIKNNLESGINILKKTVFNFNKNFISKSYYNNIISIQSKKNEDCIFLENIFINNKENTIKQIYKKIKNQKTNSFLLREKKKPNDIRYSDCGLRNSYKLKLKDEKYLIIGPLKSAQLYNNHLQLIKEIDLRNIINDSHFKSLETSFDKKQIAVLLTDKLIIFDLDNEFKIDKIYNNIFDQEERIFFTPNSDIISYGNSLFKLWKKSNDNQNYSIIKTINENSNINNLLPVNNDFFIFLTLDDDYNCNIIHFNDFELQKIKSININAHSHICNTDIFNDSIIVSYPGIIVLINIRTKEITQYYQLNICSRRFDDIPQIYLGNNDNIYIMETCALKDLYNYEFIYFNNEKKSNIYEKLGDFDNSNFFSMKIMNYKIINHSLEYIQTFKIYSEDKGVGFLDFIISDLEGKNTGNLKKIILKTKTLNYQMALSHKLTRKYYD